ncbi:porin family protein [Sinorhizobium sp. Sb3]|uniref:outer membrane protein n=1 Tax=Sinorhizobium sp. Sb3 TaxID=1358417 RepID=UPI0007C80510|nr:porin family protein [Sinorhizobium sp. Sb3]
MNTRIIAIVASAWFSATAAYSADLPELPPATPTLPPVELAPPLTWDGPYAGVSFGANWMTGFFFNDCYCETLEESFAGRRLGVFAGYNFAVSENAIVGVEGDVAYDWNDRNLYGTQVGTDMSYSARIRLGEAVGNTLFYVASGWTATNAFVENPDDSDFVNGWTLGAGVDWTINESTFLRAEYRYNDYSTANLAGVKADFDQNVFTIGIARKF